MYVNTNYVKINLVVVHVLKINYLLQVCLQAFEVHAHAIEHDSKCEQKFFLIFFINALIINI